MSSSAFLSEKDDPFHLPCQHFSDTEFFLMIFRIRATLHPMKLAGLLSWAERRIEGSKQSAQLSTCIHSASSLGFGDFLVRGEKLLSLWSQLLTPAETPELDLTGTGKRMRPPGLDQKLDRWRKETFYKPVEPPDADA